MNWKEAALKHAKEQDPKESVGVLIVIKGKELEVDYSLTWTCYKGKEKACGKCGSCVE